MKMNLKRGLLIIASLFLLSLPGQSIHAQKDMASIELRVEDESKVEGVPDYGACAEGDFNCMNDRNESIQTADFIVKSFMSLDPKIAEQEMEQDYVKYYWNSSMTLMGDYLDLFRPSTILMSMINLVTNLFEMIGLVITTFVMILYNLTSTSFISSIMDTVLTALDQLIFQWDDPNSWAYKVIILGAFVSFAIKFLSSKHRILSPSHFVNLLFQVVVSASLIVVIGIYGRPLVNHVDKMFNDLIVVVIDSESDRPLEIENKSILFDTLQMQSFKIRHFGSLDIEDASYEDEEGEMIYVSAEERLDTLLRDQTWESAWREYDSYGNNAITHNIGSSLQVLFLSILFLLHRVMLAFIYITLCALLGIVKLLKELTIVLSLYQLIYLLFKGNSNNRHWFMSRLQWMVVCMIGNVLFTTLLFFMSRMIENVSMIHPLALIGFDVLLLLLIMVAPKFLAPMMQSMMKTMTPQMLSNVLSGRSNPQDVYRNLERNLDHKKIDPKQEDEEPKLPSPQELRPMNEQELADRAIERYEEDPAKQLNDTFKDVHAVPLQKNMKDPNDKNIDTEEHEDKENKQVETSSKQLEKDAVPSTQSASASSTGDVKEKETSASEEIPSIDSNKGISMSKDKESSPSLPTEAEKPNVQGDPSKKDKQSSTCTEDELAEKHLESLISEPISDSNEATFEIQEEADLADHVEQPQKEENQTSDSTSIKQSGLEEKTETFPNKDDDMIDTSQSKTGNNQELDEASNKTDVQEPFIEEVEHSPLTHDQMTSKEDFIEEMAPSASERKKEDPLHEIETESMKRDYFHEDH